MKRVSLADQKKFEGYTTSRPFTSIFITILFTVFAILSFLLFTSLNGFGQQLTDEQKAAEYKKTITERSAKIVNTLGISDSDKFNKVVETIAGQYFNLNTIHDNTKATIASIKGQSLEQAKADQMISTQQEKKAESLKQQHSAFIAQLKKQLSDDQIEKVKNGMTYNVLNVTYTAYQDMIPTLTEEQKKKIYNWLLEARELAMDEGSSDDKHKMFGKYKGRINNYLSAEGYDMKKEEKGWQERLKEKRAKEAAQKNAQ
jgi:hypothetical protein